MFHIPVVIYAPHNIICLSMQCIVNLIEVPEPMVVDRWLVVLGGCCCPSQIIPGFVGSSFVCGCASVMSLFPAAGLQNSGALRLFWFTDKCMVGGSPLN